jgi:hypothetical protein
VVEGHLDLREHQVVGLVVGGVRAEDHLLDGVVLLDAVWEPLHGEGGPLERVGRRGRACSSSRSCTPR